MSEDWSLSDTAGILILVVASFIGYVVLSGILQWISLAIAIVILLFWVSTFVMQGYADSTQ